MFIFLRAFLAPETNMQKVSNSHIVLVELGLCSLGARRKSRFFVLGAEKRRFFGAPKKKTPIGHPPKPIFFLGHFSLGGADFLFCFRVPPSPFLPPPPPHPRLQYLNKYEVRGVFSSYGAPGARTSQSRARRREEHLWGRKTFLGAP